MTYNAAKLRDSLVLDEGYRDRVYADSKGIPTIGIGHNLTKPLAPAVVDLIYALDVAEAERAVDAFVPRWREFDDDRQRVLLELAFNLGQTRLAGFTRFRVAVRESLDGGGRDSLLRGAAEILDSDAARDLPERYGRLAKRWSG